jgi:hypothetical protein
VLGVYVTPFPKNRLFSACHAVRQRASSFAAMPRCLQRSISAFTSVGLATSWSIVGAAAQAGVAMLKMPMMTRVLAFMVRVLRTR